ncbi:MAG: mobilization protein, partial [Alistipes sp.]|nr:mobilization protein [Alistipes sp.]
MSYRVKVRERKKNKGAMLSLYLEFMPPYVAPNGECVRYENLNLELYVNPANEIQEKHNRM